MSDITLRLNVKSFASACAITWGLGVFLMGLSSWLFSWGTSAVLVIASLYHGYAPTLLGSIIGLVYALIDGFIGGLILAWIYNFMVKKCSK